MSLVAQNPLTTCQFWSYGNLAVYLAVFSTALYVNRNFNIVLVGLTYLVPLAPWGLTLENADRFLIVSLQNTVFGIIELAIFAITVKSADTPFDREHIVQLCGHVFPITLALIGLSYVARMTPIPVTPGELAAIMTIFLAGSVLRVVAVYQLGPLAFKFDIVFRESQAMKTDQLYGLVRHPSYAAMMLVVLAYAINAHHWTAGILGMMSAWFGFQFRIHHEEKALAGYFGDKYGEYQARTGMWFPKRFPGGRKAA